MFSLNWLNNFLQKEAVEESQLSQQHAEVNIFDEKAEGNHVRSAALDLYGTEKGALLELTWHPSSYKLFSKEYTSLQDAQAMFNEVKAKLLEVNKLVLQGEMEGAEEQSVALLTSLAGISTEPLQQSTNQPVTQTMAQKQELIQVSILIPALTKEAKATVQNIFFSDVNELLQWQEAQKAAQPSSGSLPGTMPSSTSDLPPLGNPTDKGPLTTPAKPSALEQMVDQRVEEKIESSLDAKARAVFENVHAETVKVMRQLGRSWEEIKDFFNRYLKYDWDDIDVYLDQFIQAEQGGEDPGAEKVKDELSEGEVGNAPPDMKSKPVVLPKPEVLPVAFSKPAVQKTAEMVRYPDSLKKGDKVRLVRSIMTKENSILQPESTGQVVQANEYSIVIESSEGRFTISKYDCVKLDKTASLSREVKSKDRMFEPCAVGQHEDCIAEVDEDSCFCECHAPGAHYVGEGYVAEPELQEQIEVEESKKPADHTQEYKELQADEQFQSMPAGHMYEDAPPVEEEFCDNCSQKGHDPERDWDKCSWGSCTCPCQMENSHKEASLELTAEKYYLDPNAEYDWETDLVDEINNKLGMHKKKWDFTSPNWEVQYEGEDKPYVEVKLLGPVKKSKQEPTNVGHTNWNKQEPSVDTLKRHDAKTFLWQKDSKPKTAEVSLVEPVYECAKCGSTFNKPQEVSYREYPGASSMSVDFVSPCCSSSYNEVGDNDSSIEANQTSRVEKMAKGERPKIRELKDQLARATKPTDIKSLCDAIDALEGRMDKEKERKDQRREEKAKKQDSSTTEDTTSVTAAKTTSEAQEFMSKHVKKHVDEGKSQDQAIAIAYEEAREAGYSVPEATKKQAATPTDIRTLLDAKPREFGYTVIEYNLTNGQWKKKEIKVTDTKMRMEAEGQQYEVHGPNGWQLVPRNIFMEYFQIFKDIRQKNNFGGEVPQPLESPVVSSEEKSAELKKK